MVNWACFAMGGMDLIAGGFILFGFYEHFLGIILGIAMIIKGGISFI
jgi:hypothetical protein